MHARKFPVINLCPTGPPALQCLMSVPVRGRDRFPFPDETVLFAHFLFSGLRVNDRNPFAGNRIRFRPARLLTAPTSVLLNRTHRQQHMAVGVTRLVVNSPVADHPLGREVLFYELVKDVDLLLTVIFDW